MRGERRRKKRGKTRKRRQKNVAQGCAMDQTPEVLDGQLNCENRIGISEILEGTSDLQVDLNIGLHNSYTIK